MAFGGSGFSFGSNNNNTNNQTSGFGGFGNNAASNPGFGSSTTNTGFGASTTAANPFGASTSTFGSNTGGFGNNNTGTTSLFGGNKAPSNPFGTNTASTGGLFGTSSNAPSGGFGSGGFGTSTNTNTNTGTFGGGTSGAFGTFGSTTKPAFGSSATTTTPLFGQGGTGTTGGFGSNTSTFGGSGTALNQSLPPCEGTNSTPFSPTIEKETNGTSNSYQTISFQQPYQKYSLEELRLADYNAGRRYGNGSGQAGAFGSSSFGGFGSNNNNNAGGFGASNTNPFGSTATTSTGGFGSNTTTTGFGGGGLFGNTANKPGGLFGAQTSAPSTTGGIFGSANNNTTGGFGSTTGGFGANNNTTSGGLFGNAANKPAGGLFGNTSNTTTTGGFGGFGNNNNPPASNTGGGLFGGNNNSTNTTGGLFGNNNQSSSTAGGLFGSNNTAQNKPAGLFGGGGGFGSQTTQAQPAGGLFGTNNNTSTSAGGGGLFGNNNTTNTGGLFGNTNSNTAGTGLFGSSNNTNTTSGGGLFGNAQNKPGGLFGGNTTSGGLFGTNNNTTSTNTGGLFGGNTNNTSGGLFGNNNANKPTTSLFGTQSTNQQGGGLFGSTNNNNGLFGASQSNQQNNQQQQDQFKVSSLLDPNPYGQSSIWTGLPAPTPENAKPVFTPLTATQKMKESMMKPPPSLRLNQSRYMTPPRRNGFGFSYSTYGTPNSAASTPGGASLSGSMYGSRGWSGGSFGRSFSKSASVQNLRAQFASDGDDIWKPGAFASAHRNSSGSIKRLTIDRSIRNDLFSRPVQPALTAPERPSGGSSGGGPSGSQSNNAESTFDTSNKLKKRVSFDNNTTGGQLNSQNGALVRTESDEEERVEERASESRTVNNSNSSSRSKELAVVPEDRESDHITRPPPPVQSKSDPKPGEYWMRPSRTEMSKLPRDRLQNFKDFQVGRYGCGQVTFNSNVDLTALPLDDLYDKIVEIRLRSVTVYPDASMKPPVGKGLNVPSTIAVENSWPRSRKQPSSVTSGPIFDKHIDRLKKIPGTEFVDYDVGTGVWTFRVAHYTRYGLDYDDDDDMSELTAPPDTIEKLPEDDSMMEEDADDYDHFDENDDDDTFAFKQKIVPGGFGRRSVIDYDPGSSVQAPDEHNEDNGSDLSVYSEEEMSEDEPSMAGSFPDARAMNFDSPNKPILKAPGTPGKPLLDLEGDWAEQLQRTISPRKQNRDVLRDAQSKVLLDRVYSPIKPSTVNKQNFRTSVDIMSSIFGRYEEERSANVSGRKQTEDNMDFEFPYAKRAKTFDSDLDGLSENDRRWHASFRAKFTGLGDLLSKKRKLAPGDEVIIEEGNQAVVRSSLSSGREEVFDTKLLLASSQVVIKDGVPFLSHLDQPFSYLIDQIIRNQSRIESLRDETFVYRLAHILFDTYDDKYSSNLPTTPAVKRDELMQHVLHDRLSEFLADYIRRSHGDHISTVEKSNPTAAAVWRLTHHDVKGACDLLQKVGNYRLMVLVSQLGSAGKDWQEDVRAQLDAWREQGLLSEMTDDVRALYEICAGNVTICLGRSAVGTPVEDRAKTFSISEEYEFDWLQAFALGFWYGKDEKTSANGQTKDGVVSIENAVQQFAGRCDRGEETEKPGDDTMWVLLKLYAASQGVDGVEVPVFPQALEEMNSTWDVTSAFRFHHAIAGHVRSATVDKDKADDLAGLLAWQSSSRDDVAGAVAALLHIEDAVKRQETIQALLERFAGFLPDPSDNAPTSDDVAQSSTDLWTILTTQLKLPPSWIFTAKALYARAVDADSYKELTYLIAACSWQEAHECLVHRVAPGCIVDEDYDTLSQLVALFGTDADRKVQDWVTGGGVYGDFVKLVTSKNKHDDRLVDTLRARLVEMGKKFSKNKTVELGKLPVEELEERVAVKEMSKVVAGLINGGSKEILNLPITSDVRLAHTVALAGEYYNGVMSGGATLKT